jgi:hypothetical protein
MTFELIDLIFAFILGFVSAWMIMSWIVARLARRIRDALEQVLAEEAPQASLRDRVASGQIIPLNVEVENDQYLCYNANTNEFVCQGTNVTEITERFQSRFPGFDAFFNSGNEQAVKTLRQQLKDKRENSSSVGSTS